MQLDKQQQCLENCLPGIPNNKYKRKSKGNNTRDDYDYIFKEIRGLSKDSSSLLLESILRSSISSQYQSWNCLILSDTVNLQGQLLQLLQLLIVELEGGFKLRSYVPTDSKVTEARGRRFLLLRYRDRGRLCFLFYPLLFPILLFLLETFLESSL